MSLITTFVNAKKSDLFNQSIRHVDKSMTTFYFTSIC